MQHGRDALRDSNSSGSIEDDLVAAGCGDEIAFQRVYAATAGRLLALARHVTRDSSAAQDVVQIAFIKAWTNAARFDPARSSAMTWLATIVRNSAIDWWRAHNRRDEVSDAVLDVIADEAEPADERIIRQQREEQAGQMIGQLQADRQDVIRGAFYDGLTYAELARREGVALGTMKSRIRRSLVAMREGFDNG